MPLLNLHAWPLPALIAIYAAAAAVVWFAGTKASTYADTVSKRTGIGGAVIGMVMLGAITSLPEIGTSATAALGGNANLAVSNLLGGVAFQVVVLAIVDTFVGRNALTVTVPNPSVMLQAIACILLLALAVAGSIAGEVSLLGVGAWATGMLLVYGVAIVFVHGQEKNPNWLPKSASERAHDRPLGDAPDEMDDQKDSGGLGPTSKRLVLLIVAAGAAILFAGVVLTWSAEAIASRTGLDVTIAGLTLLAIATSLPELSTAISAVRIGRNDLAIGDVFGGNMFDLMLIFVVDLLFIGPPVLSKVGGYASFAGLLGIILTTIYLVGMIERRNRTIFNMGYDSFLVLLCYLGGMALIFGVAIR